MYELLTALLDVQIETLLHSLRGNTGINVHSLFSNDDQPKRTLAQIALVVRGPHFGEMSCTSRLAGLPFTKMAALQSVMGREGG